MGPGADSGGSVGYRLPTPDPFLEEYALLPCEAGHPTDVILTHYEEGLHLLRLDVTKASSQQFRLGERGAEVPGIALLYCHDEK